MAGEGLPPMGRRFATRAAPEEARAAAHDAPERLAALARIAGLVDFDGSATWLDLLGVDPVPASALLATADARARPAPAPPADGADPRSALLGRLAVLFAAARDVDRRLAPSKAARRPDYPVLAAAERAVEAVLAPRVRRALDEMAAVGLAALAAESLGALGGGLHPRWQIGGLAGAARETRAALAADAVEAALLAIDDAAEAFARELSRIAARGREAFWGALSVPDRAPHVALLMAFTELLRHAEASVDAVPGRIVDHYIREALREAPRDAEPDRLVLVAVPKPGARVLIPRGAMFDAGEALGGRGIIFAADGALAVTGAACAAARVWRLEPGGAPGCMECAAVLAQPGGVLGGPERGIAGDLAFAPAEPALVLASPALGARGRVRRFRIVLRWRHAGLGPIAEAEVGVLASGPEGWVPVAPRAVATDAGGVAVELLFEGDAAAIAVGPPGLCPGVEALALTFGRAACALSEAAIASVGLDIAVVDAAGIALSDADAPGSAAAAAAPFGAPARVGRALRVDHPALAAQDVHRVALGLRWADLPASDRGFADHYRYYAVDRDGRVGGGPPLDNLSFQARVSMPSAEIADTPLFQARDGGERAPNVLAEGGAGFAPGPSPSRSGPLARWSWFAGEAAADSSAGRGPGCVIVALTGPAEAFGDDLYAANVAYAGMRAAAAGAAGTPARGEAAALALPSPPWRPALASVRLDYARRVTPSSRADALALHHRAPGEDLRAVPEGAPVLPALPSRPALDLGLRGLGAHRALSLLVRIVPAEAGRASDREVDWSCLTPDGWAPLEASEGAGALPGAGLVEDGTRGLRSTGLVRVGLPAAARPDRDGLVWLRAALGPRAALPAVTAVVPDAFAAVRVLGDPRDPLHPVPPGTIARAPAFPGLARLDQPMAPEGGRAPEDEGDLRRRATERLRHRGRAIRASDVERIVLDACPDVARVRAASAGPEGARVAVVAVPAAPGPRPQFTPARRVAIARAVAERTSPFAIVEVLAPAYRAVRVEARVELAAGVDPIDAAVRIRGAVEALLSPAAVPGLAPGDGNAALRAALRALVAAHPTVRRLARLDVTTDGSGGFARVPVPGEVIVVPVLPVDPARLPAGRAGKP